MKNNLKRLVSLMLILATLLGMGILPVNAVDTVAPEKAAEEALNPHYTQHVPMDAVEEANEDTLMDSLSATYYGLNESAKLLLDAMIQRKTTIYLYVYDPEASISFTDVFELALSEELATTATAGDYLKWSWSGYKSTWDYVSNGNWILTVNMTYYSTSSQESWFRSRLTTVMNSLPLSGKTTYQKYKTIYQYICDNVDYDHVGLATHNDAYSYNDDYSIFTAYACLYDGEAVCQGYACLFYAMCRTAGIPVRIVTSVDHAWNIVKLDGIWYSVDSTWDGQDPVTTWDWFLLGSRSFDPRHPREPGYEDFPYTHPHSKYNYHACTGSHVYETRKVTKQPTCTATGTKADICYYCGRSYNVTTIAALGHDYKLIVNKAATSTEAGYKQYSCSRCSKIYYTDHVPATGTGNPFIDVHSGKFYYNPVQWAVDMGVTAGTSSMEFSPDDACTRAQVVTFLWRAAGKPEPKSTSHPFTDVRSNAFYYKAMLWAVENGITAGTSKTTFSPDDPCTRAQVVTFLYRAAGKPAVRTDDEDTADVVAFAEEISAEDENSAFSCYKTILEAVESGVVFGDAEAAYEFPLEPGDVIADVGDHEYSETEPNDSMAKARKIYSDYTIYGSIKGYDLDYFVFTLAKKSTITILTGAERSGLSFLLMDASGNALATPSYTDVESLYYDGLAGTLNAGTYYLVLLDMNAEYASYSTFDYILYYEAVPVSSSHTHSYTAKVTQPTCTAQGYTTYTCSCGASYKDNYVSATGHSYNSGVVTVAPTTTTTGVKTYTCTKCGHTKTETIPADPSGSPFVDVSAKSYYYKAVLWAVENGITSGTSKTKFSPDDACTRGQVVTFLYRYIN